MAKIRNYPKMESVDAVLFIPHKNFRRYVVQSAFQNMGITFDEHTSMRKKVELIRHVLKHSMNYNMNYSATPEGPDFWDKVQLAIKYRNFETEEDVNKFVKKMHSIKLENWEEISKKPISTSLANRVKAYTELSGLEYLLQHLGFDHLEYNFKL